MLDKNDPERPTAMLTTDERRGLLTEWRGKKPEGGRKSRSYHQREIVKRVRHSLLDFTLLYENLSEKRRIEIFDIGYPPDDEEEEAELKAAENDLHDGMVDTVAFLFLLLEGDHTSPGAHYRTRQLTFADVLDAGVSKAVKRIEGDSLSGLASVDVDYRGVEIIEPESIDADRLIDKIAQGDVADLSGGEARALIQLADRNEARPDTTAENRGFTGWEDLGKQIQKRRGEREDIITPDEMAELSDEEIMNRLRNADADSEE